MGTKERHFISWHHRSFPSPLVLPLFEVCERRVSEAVAAVTTPDSGMASRSQFPVSYQNGDRGKHGEVIRGDPACDLGDRTPTQIENCYRKQSAIESSYRLFRNVRAATTTQDPIVRFAFVVVSFLLENLWLVLRWAVVARPRRGGRDLPEEFTFSMFCDWIRHALEEELERRWKVEMNGGGVPDAYTAAAG